MKLPNGYGTVYKLPGNRRRPYIARVPKGTELVYDKKTGEEKEKLYYQTIGYFETKKEALNALAKHHTEPLAERAHSITLKEVYERWIETPTFLDLSRQTQDNYRACFKYLARYANRPFKDLKTDDYEDVIKNCKKDGLSKSTCHKIKILVNLLYKYAIKNDITNKNYGELIDIGQFKDTKERESFTELEVKKIEESVGKVEWADTILILIYTGMRVSEMLLLTKFNVDLTNWTITGGIKTDAGKDRIIPIHKKIRPIIKKWYDKNGERLICTEKGKPIGSRKYREELYLPALEKIGVRLLNPHSCRHTCASLLAKAGADTLAIQRILGHASYSTTADIYTHVDVDELQKAIDMI